MAAVILCASSRARTPARRVRAGWEFPYWPIARIGRQALDEPLQLRQRIVERPSTEPLAFCGLMHRQRPADGLRGLGYTVMMARLERSREGFARCWIAARPARAVTAA
jgi:hypothetical protein